MDLYFSNYDIYDPSDALYFDCIEVHKNIGPKGV
jgi:hypothetical protein